MDLGTDPDVLGQWAREVEQAGYDELFIPEHVVGVNAGRRPDWRPLNPNTLKNDKPIYDHTFPFYEPFVAMGYLAAVTDRIGLTSGVMIAPQRQTALMAKQAAIADVLSRGRIRLGVGVGWNDAEFDALGADFTTRGRRLDEQLRIMRQLWTQESVTFDGQFDHLTAVGLAPLPIQRPIPIIVGGDSGPAMARAAELGDGWFLTHPAAECIERTQRFWRRVEDLGRRDDMTLVGTVYQGHRQPEELLEDIALWAELGATHLNVRTSSQPAQGTGGQWTRKPDVGEHIDALSDIRRLWLECTE
jgi:probable F420-dependent oxidoreductase